MPHKFQFVVLCIFSSKLQIIPDAALRPDDGLRADLTQLAPQAVRRPLPERKADEKS